MVQLICIGDGVKLEDYSDVPDVAFLKVDAVEGVLPAVDLLVAFRYVENGTLIRAMRFFKNVKKSATRVLVTETYPNEDNVVRKVGGEKQMRLRINTAGAPFWFPVPIYEYENEEENSETVVMQIAAVTVSEMFEEKVTPSLGDLVDPRKRFIQE